MPIQLESVDIFGDVKLGALVAKEIQAQLRGHGLPTDHWDIELRTVNAQFLLAARGPDRRSNLPPAWTLGGAEGGRYGDVYVY